MTANPLRVEGLVEGGPLELSPEDLAACAEEHQVADVSQLVASRQGRAVRFRALMDAAPLQEGARWVELESEDGAFVASLPLEEVADDGVVMYAGPEGPLSAKEGGPFRLLIPGYRDACANVKFLGRVAFLDRPGRDNRPSNETEHAAHHEAQDGHDGHACKHDGPIG